MCSDWCGLAVNRTAKTAFCRHRVFGGREIAAPPLKQVKERRPPRNGRGRFEGGRIIWR
jgi:hypothetical protein